ncbi:MFS transporter [Nocardioides aurantiacus]|uniref:MFS transporter n=1 Tax=Nocardioides aurantiacus TaxID=86796 RepID=UPI000F48F402|nr:MFS transporter [Nocardioides aurantiacus]
MSTRPGSTTPGPTPPPTGALRSGEPRARWVLAATVLGAALTFIDATVVNLALPRIGEELGAGSQSLTWVVNAYALALAALVLVGGALGDTFGQRRVFLLGVTLFAVASGACGLAPDVGTLIAGRAVQGVGAALLTPGSLAILQHSFAPGDRARAIGSWSGLTGVAGAIGPFVGGWLIAVGDWRWAFLVNLPLALIVVVVTRRHVPDVPPSRTAGHLDWPGALWLAAALGLVSYALTAWASYGLTDGRVLLGLALGALAAVGFVLRERSAREPLVPGALLGSRVFVVTNAVTLLAYAALGAVFFSVGIAVQVGAGYSPLLAGLALSPVTLCMLLLSSRAGSLSDRLGPRLPMTAGPLLAAVGVVWLGRIDAEVSYALDVLAPATVFGLGLTLMVTPLTATVLASAPDDLVGLASGVNNAAARTAGLVAVAAVPLVGGLGGSGLTDPARVVDGFGTVMGAAAALLVVAGLLSFVAVPRRQPRREDCAACPPEHHCSPGGPPAAVEHETT